MASSFFLCFLSFSLLLSHFKPSESSKLDVEELSWLDDNMDEEVNMVQSRHDSLRKCNYGSGKWVYDQTYPLYDSATCPYLSDSVTCRKNGRPDSDYEKWKWKPYGCSIPRFDALEFLGRMRRKRIMLVGDSIMRNQWESLVCLVESVVPSDRKTVTYAGPMMAFHALDFETSIEFCWAPLLVELKKGPGNKRILHLDLIEENAKYWRSADVLVFDSAHWWTHSDKWTSWDLLMEGNNVARNMNRMVAYQKGLQTWAKWVDLNLDPRQSRVIFRSMSPRHNRAWPIMFTYMWIVMNGIGGNKFCEQSVPQYGIRAPAIISPSSSQSTYRDNGWKCYRQREPLGYASHPHVPEEMVVLKGVLKRMRFPVYLEDITAMSALRRDAHPSVYARSGGSAAQKQHRTDHGAADCSHWCLPGVPDIWNEMLNAML